MLERLLKTMIIHAPTAVDALRQALDAENFPALVLNAHSLKASAANLGEQGLSELCQRLENAANANSIESCRPLVSEIEISVSATVRKFQAKLSRQTEKVA